MVMVMMVISSRETIATQSPHIAVRPRRTGRGLGPQPPVQHPAAPLYNGGGVGPVLPTGGEGEGEGNGGASLRSTRLPSPLPFPPPFPPPPPNGGPEDREWAGTGCPVGRLWDECGYQHGERGRVGGCCLVACFPISLPQVPEAPPQTAHLPPWFCGVKETGTSGAASPHSLKPITLGPLHPSILAPWDSTTLLPWQLKFPAPHHSSTLSP